MNTRSDESGAGPGRPERLMDKVTASPGGAMADEVGVITGDLTAATTLRPDGQATINAQYTGADE